ncbi:hypothetical protein [Aquicoccus porphyridii]|uniref:Lipoprotein n=1 Tax=Aquicoccus porphyridii TaxID=1852029 RepID=A0A5A9Z7U7_9RHOB|nr:hypothetical protein [Aquicoccus porphyridii]KAA0913260.1 hypothetical protein FLO80_13310 [Aquicoccus porphyridii]RAI52276.1 hypothetical protein DOO74_18610 [Rhodobacteraceae bacterium AsT-22]
MFKRLFSAAIIFGAAALAPPSPALAQIAACLPRDVLVTRLEERHKEHLAGGGLQSPQRLIEIWASEETGSFTVFVTRPNGISCILATGQHWRGPDPAKPGGVGG